MSAMPCGCDPELTGTFGIGWVCAEHREDYMTGRGKPSVVEIRVVDPKTGGEKGQKIERYDLVPPEFEEALARHYGVGTKKYADRNWEKGYKWGLSVGALRRHLGQWMQGEDIDEETGSHHLIAVAWHAAALYVFQLRGIGTDDVRRKDARS